MSPRPILNPWHHDIGDPLAWPYGAIMRPTAAAYVLATVETGPPQMVMVQTCDTYRHAEELARTIGGRAATVLPLARPDVLLYVVDDIAHHIARLKLETIRTAIIAESVSYGELAELQDLADYIEPGDVLLAEWAGIPEEEFLAR
jgi:hypothetical protein